MQKLANVTVYLPAGPVVYTVGAANVAAITLQTQSGLQVQITNTDRTTLIYCNVPVSYTAAS